MRVASTRQPRDGLLMPEVVRLLAENRGDYGRRKMPALLKQQGWTIGRDQTERPMHLVGVRGVRLRRVRHRRLLTSDRGQDRRGYAARGGAVVAGADMAAWGAGTGWIHHAGYGSNRMPMVYTDRLVDLGATPSTKEERYDAYAPARSGNHRGRPGRRVPHPVRPRA